MKGYHLGEFEELTLSMVAILQGEAYGVLVMEELENQVGRTANISAVHSSLRRLEAKGLINSQWSEATKERGGRRKRLFVISAAGTKILSELRDQRLRLWNQIPGLQTS